MQLRILMYKIKNICITHCCYAVNDTDVFYLYKHNPIIIGFISCFSCKYTHSPIFLTKYQCLHLLRCVESKYIDTCLKHISGQL